MFGNMPSHTKNTSIYSLSYKKILKVRYYYFDRCGSGGQDHFWLDKYIVHQFEYISLCRRSYFMSGKKSIAGAHDIFFSVHLTSITLQWN